jgi:hypothetical protein
MFKNYSRSNDTSGKSSSRSHLASTIADTQSERRLLQHGWRVASSSDFGSDIGGSPQWSDGDHLVSNMPPSRTEDVAPKRKQVKTRLSVERDCESK